MNNIVFIRFKALCRLNENVVTAIREQPELADCRPIAELRTHYSERQLSFKALYQFLQFGLFLHAQRHGLHILTKPDVSHATGAEIDLALLSEVVRYLKLPKMRIVQGELDNRIGNIIVCFYPR